MSIEATEVGLLAFIGIAGLWLGYRAFDKAVDSRNIRKTIAWAVAWVSLSAVGAYGLVVALIGIID